MARGFVYLLASKRNGTLYLGVTSNLFERVAAHRQGRGSAFVKKYGVTRLVWFEEHPLCIPVGIDLFNQRYFPRALPPLQTGLALDGIGDLLEKWNH